MSRFAAKARPAIHQDGTGNCEGDYSQYKEGTVASSSAPLVTTKMPPCTLRDIHVTFSGVFILTLADVSWYFFRVLCHVIQASTHACLDCQETSQYMVFTNKLASAIDLLAYQLRVNYNLYHCCHNDLPWLEISAGQRTMSVQNWDLSSQIFAWV